MSQKTSFPHDWIRFRCQNFARLPALFAVITVLAFSSLGQAQNSCQGLFQFETPLLQYKPSLNRSEKMARITEESALSLLLVKEELQSRLQRTSHFSLAKRREAREIVKMIDRLKETSKTSQDDLFEIMARYSILISHGYIKNLKDEYVWHEDLISQRGRSGAREGMGDESNIAELMKEKNFRKFRDEAMFGLRAMYNGTFAKGEKPVFVYTFKDISISDFSMNADSGFFLVAMTRTNGHSFDNNKDFSALTFFQHDVAHVDLLQMWRKIFDNKMTEDGLPLPTLPERVRDFEKMRTLYPVLDQHFTPFERRFVRITLFTYLHEYGITPSQLIYQIKKDPEGAADAAFSFIRGNEDFQRPMKKEVAELNQIEHPEKTLAPILTKLVKVWEGIQ